MTNRIRPTYVDIAPTTTVAASSTQRSICISGRWDLFAGEVLVKPADHFSEVIGWIDGAGEGGAVGGAGDAQELYGDAGGLQFGRHFFALRDVDAFVFVAVHEEEGRIVRSDVGDGGGLDVGAVFGGSLVVGEGAGHAKKEVAVGAGEKIDGGGAGDDALDFGALAFDGIRVRREAAAVESAEHADEVATGGAAGSPDPIGVDAEFGGVVADEADGALDVFNGGGIAEAGQRAVVDAENGVAGVGEGGGVLFGLAVGFEFGGGVRERRGPAGAGDVDDAVAVGVGGFIDVEEEGGAGVHAVGDVFLDGELGGRKGESEEGKQIGAHGWESISWCGWIHWGLSFLWLN